jgi:hypothetical protein
LKPHSSPEAELLGIGEYPEIRENELVLKVYALDGRGCRELNALCRDTHLHYDDTGADPHLPCYPEGRYRAPRSNGPLT